MITKLLFTALIVAGVIFYTRYRGEARKRRPLRSEPGTVRSPLYWRLAPLAALLVVVGVSVFVFWLEWKAEHQIFTVRVIDTRSGDVRQYAVYRDGISGRSFRTIDGRLVTLADVERMELVEGVSSTPGTAPSAGEP